MREERKKGKKKGKENPLAGGHDPKKKCLRKRGNPFRVRGEGGALDWGCRLWRGGRIISLEEKPSKMSQGTKKLCHLLKNEWGMDSWKKKKTKGRSGYSWGLGGPHERISSRGTASEFFRKKRGRTKYVERRLATWKGRAHRFPTSKRRKQSASRLTQERERD